MDAEEFLTQSIQPVTKQMDMYSNAAEKLLLMTACHESGGFKYRAQVGGPALSYYQIEPNSLNDLYDNYLAYRPDREALVNSFLPDGMERLDALENDDDYATAVARMMYARVSEALPAEDDDVAMSEYCKKYWNTEAGAATAQKYLDDYNLYKPEGYS